MLILSLTFIAIAAYAFASSYVLSRLFHQEGPKQKITLIASSLAIISHMLVLVNAIFTNLGPNMSFANVALLICWAIVISVTALSLRLPATLLLPVVYGFAALLLFASIFMPHSAGGANLRYDSALVSHISLSFLAYCLLVMAALYAVQLHFIDKRLKQKDKALVFSHLPPLMQVEQQLYQLVTVGTGVLTLALLIGVLFLDGMFESHALHKTVLSAISWVLFSFVTIKHFTTGWRGHASSILIFVATLILTLAYFGSRFVQEILLDKV